MEMQDSGFSGGQMRMERGQHRLLPQGKKEHAMFQSWRARRRHRQWISAFFQTFGFLPGSLGEDRARKEVLMKLGLLAKEAQETAQSRVLFSSVGIDDLGMAHCGFGSYAAASSNYLRAVRIVSHFDPSFGNQLPHWTELAAFVQDGREKTSTANLL